MRRPLGYLFKVITDKMIEKADKDMEQYGLTFTQSRVLGFLRDKECVTQKEIEKHLEVSHPTVVGIVSRMEQNGFVTTWFDPADKRNKMVKLTEKAKKTGELLEASAKIHDREMFYFLTEEEIVQLGDMLTRIYEHFSR